MSTEIDKKLDTIISSLARIEERVSAHKEIIHKLENDVENINKDINRSKGALALITSIGILVSLKTLFAK